METITPFILSTAVNTSTDYSLMVFINFVLMVFTGIAIYLTLLVVIPVVVVNLLYTGIMKILEMCIKTFCSLNVPRAVENIFMWVVGIIISIAILSSLFSGYQVTTYNEEVSVNIVSLKDGVGGIYLRGSLFHADGGSYWMYSYYTVKDGVYTKQRIKEENVSIVYTKDTPKVVRKMQYKVTRAATLGSKINEGILSGITNFYFGFLPSDARKQHDIKAAYAPQRELISTTFYVPEGSIEETIDLGN